MNNYLSVPMMLQVVGTLFLCIGAWLIMPAAGWLTAGVGLLAFGLAAERKA